MSNKGIFSLEGDRSKYPQPGKDGKLDIDLSSQQYIKLWQGPNHPGITGNMSSV